MNVSGGVERWTGDGLIALRPWSSRWGCAVGTGGGVSWTRILLIQQCQQPGGRGALGVVLRLALARCGTVREGAGWGAKNCLYEAAALAKSRQVDYSASEGE